MRIDDRELSTLELESTLFFPVSANPLGFNHIAAAELMLAAHPRWRRVVFILSNGRHPDPTKSNAELSPAQRLALAEAVVQAVADPQRSHFAKLAQQAETPLHVSPQALCLSTVEFPHSRPVPTVETVGTILAGRAAQAAQVNWFAGSDLIRRMADPLIFADDDVRILTQSCRYAILERPGDPLAAALDEFTRRRGLTLAHDAHDASAAPEWLSNYLHLSSTLIRHAAEAGDPLAGMLPRPAAEAIAGQGLYAQGRPVTRELDEAGRAIGGRTRLQLVLQALDGRLAAAAARVAGLLVERREAGRPHSLAVAETSAGGFLTCAFAGRAGASRYFRQGRFAYDQVAKEALIGAQGDIASSVSGQMVAAMAQGLRAQALTDFALAESGMAGPPDGRRRSVKSGASWIALATPQGTHTEQAQLNPFLTRKEHQYEFALHAVGMLENWLLAHRD
ncbi:MAG: CinA family protein [Candidatus Lambdaproteobacteria bacterium]|nr:CinA family protein [Candidatus Lambdaproteobacteria bacterium]